MAISSGDNCRQDDCPAYQQHSALSIFVSSAVVRFPIRSAVCSGQLDLRSNCPLLARTAQRRGGVPHSCSVRQFRAINSVFCFLSFTFGAFLGFLLNGALWLQPARHSSTDLMAPRSLSTIGTAFVVPLRFSFCHLQMMTIRKLDYSIRAYL